MKTIIDRSEHDAILAKWRGAPARIWIFDVTFTRLGLRLSRLGEPEVLYILGANCEHIIGPFSWENSDLAFSRKDESGHAFDLVFDKKAGFELHCLSVVLARGPATDFDKTFDNFLGDAPP